MTAITTQTIRLARWPGYCPEGWDFWRGEFC